MSNADCDAIYARVSSARQEREGTIQTQLFKIKERFDPEGREVYFEYLDNGVSGATMDRPGLQACLAAAHAGCFNRLLVDHPDRLSRGESWERGFLQREFAEAGVKVIYTSYEQPDTPEGELSDDVISAAARYARKRIHQGMVNGRARRLSQGAIWWVRRPFGWRMADPVRGDKYPRPEPHPDEAPIVKEIFDLVLAGKTAYAVIGVLNARGLRTTYGKPWTRVSVARVLHNPIHSGRPAYDRYVRADPVKRRKDNPKIRKSSRRERPREEWQHIDLPCRIVTPEDQERVLAQLITNRRLSPRNTKHPYLLSGLLRCGCQREDEPGTACGRLMSGTTFKRGGHRYYRCSRTKGEAGVLTKGCNGRIGVDNVEGKVWSKLVHVLSHPDTLLAEMEKSHVWAGDLRRQRTAQLADAHARQTAIQAQLDSLLLASLTPGADRTTYTRVEAQLCATRDTTAQEIAYLEEGIAVAENSLRHFEDFEEYCRGEEAMIAALSYPAAEGTESDPEWAFSIKRSIIQTMLKEVWVNPDGNLRLEGYLPSLQERKPVASENHPPSRVFLKTAPDRLAGYRWSLTIAA